MSNWSDKTFAWFCAIGTAVCLTTLLMLGPLPQAGASENASENASQKVRITHMCTHPDKRDSDCGAVFLYATGSVRQDGDMRAASGRDLSGCWVRYLGWARKDLSNHTADSRGFKYMTVEYNAKKRGWHLYKTRC